jgi:hypothetical protein
MKFRPAPAEDLINYVNELYIAKKNKYKYNTIFDVMNEYYCSLSNHRTILPLKELAFEDWCDLNISDTMDNCPKTSGVIIYKTENKKRQYGLLYYSGIASLKPNAQTDNLSYYDIDSTGCLVSHPFLITEWEGWGVPAKYFNLNFKDYIDSNNRFFGERVLKFGELGHDIMLFQTILQRVFPEIKITRIFDI